MASGELSELPAGFFVFYPLSFRCSNFSAIHANSLDWLKPASGCRLRSAGLDKGELIGRIWEVKLVAESQLKS